MELPEKLKIAEDFNEFTLKEKGSSFIAQVYSVKEEKEINDIFAAVKKKYYNASHHCFAYKLINGKLKYSDDGEPNGTAGKRILNAIEHFDLQNQLVVVIRYFGGTKLGVGPLGKAYYTAAKSVLQNSKIKTKILHKKIIIKTDFNNINHVHHVLASNKVKIEKTDYDAKINFTCIIQPSKIVGIKIELSELSKGQIEIFETEEILYI